MLSKSHRRYQQKWQIPRETNLEVRKKMDHFPLAFGDVEHLGFPAIAELLCNLIYRYIVT